MSEWRKKEGAPSKQPRSCPLCSGVFLSPEICAKAEQQLSIKPPQHNKPNSQILITVNMSGAIPTSTSVTESAVINGMSLC
jgi:hypothetical protein